MSRREVGGWPRRLEDLAEADSLDWSSEINVCCNEDGKSAVRAIRWHDSWLFEAGTPQETSSGETVYWRTVHLLDDDGSVRPVGGVAITGQLRGVCEHCGRYVRFTRAALENASFRGKSRIFGASTR